MEEIGGHPLSKWSGGCCRGSLVKEPGGRVMYVLQTIILRIMAPAVLLLALPAGCGNGSSEQVPPEVVTIPVPVDLDVVDPQIRELILRAAGAVRAGPADPDRWSVLSQACLAHAFYGEASMAFSRCLELDPTRSRERYMLAVVLWRLEKQQDAVAEAETALASAGGAYGPGLRRLAEWKLGLGQVEEAVVLAERALAAAPDLPGIRETVIEVYLQGGRRGDARDLVVTTIAEGKGTPYLYQLAAQVYRQAGETAKMDDAMARAGPRPEHVPDPWLDAAGRYATGLQNNIRRAMSIMRTQGAARALPLLEQLHGQAPDDMDLAAALAMAYLQAGQIEEGLRVFANGEVEGNGSLNFWKQYAAASLAMVQQGRDRDQWLATARRCVSRAMAIDGSHHENYGLMGKVHEASQEGDAAIDAWRRAADLDPRGGTPYFYEIARIEMAAGRWEEAVRTIEAILQAVPDATVALGYMVRARLRLGDVNGAEAALQRLEEVAPGDAAVSVLRGEIRRLREGRGGG